jgi:hypothetical protein
MVIAKGEPMLAEDILRLNFLPVGTILMFDGSGWTNDSTIPGWYKCDGSNGTPNLVDRFIRGSSSAYNGATSGSAYGGASTITTGNLPAHSHSFKNESITSDSGGAHTHTINDPGHTHTVPLNNEDYSGSSSQVWNNRNNNTVDTSKSTTGITILSTNSAHAHAFNLNGKSTNNTGDGSAYWQPYYSVIYIRKCANR